MTPDKHGVFDLTVCGKHRLSPRMVRVDLAGAALDAFPTDHGDIIKLHFPVAGGGYVSRAYTVAAFDRTARILSIDFLLHEPAGVASAWADAAVPGDPLRVVGPRGARDLSGVSPVLLLADLSGLPAVAGLLAELPADAEGQAILAIPDAAEARILTGPPGVTVSWCVDPAIDALLPALAGTDPQLLRDGFVFMAAESSVVKRARAWLAAHGRPGRARTRMTGYWKLGLSEEAYHDERHREMDEV